MDHLEDPELPGNIQANPGDHSAFQFRPASHNQGQALLLGCQRIFFGGESVSIGLKKPSQVRTAPFFASRPFR
jgi:hypothetical protein